MFSFNLLNPLAWNIIQNQNTEHSTEQDIQHNKNSSIN